MLGVLRSTIFIFGWDVEGKWAVDRIGERFGEFFFGDLLLFGDLVGEGERLGRRPSGETTRICSSSSRIPAVR